MLWGKRGLSAHNQGVLPDDAPPHPDPAQSITDIDIRTTSPASDDKETDKRSKTISSSLIGGRGGEGVGGVVHLDTQDARSNSDLGQGQLETLLDEAAIEAAGQEDGASAYLWMLTCFAGIGGLLFGYDTGAISSVLVQIGDDIQAGGLSDGEKEMITSALILGALLAALCAGTLADILGRKNVIGIADILFVAGAAMQAASSSYWVMVGGRFVMGWGVGAASCVVPVYIQEVAPAAARGRLTTLNSAAITGGQVVAYAIGAAFENVPHGWRYIIAIGGIPPIVQAIAIHFFFPESPRWLVKAGKPELAAQGMQRMYPKATPRQIDAKVQVLDRHIKVESIPWLTRLRHVMSDAATRRAVLICSMLMGAQQLSGFNSLMYYSATIFSYAGLKNASATGLIVSGTNFVFTLVAVKWVDKKGRRKFLLWSIPSLIGGLVFTSVVFYFMTKPTGFQLEDGHTYPNTLTSLMIVGMVIYVASYSAGLGNIPWNQGEFFDYSSRGIGTSISTAVCWSGNLLISATFLRIMSAMTPSGAFGFYAGLSLMFYIAIIFMYPETAGISLEEVRLILEHGYGVRKSMKMRGEKQALWKAQKEEARMDAVQRGEVEKHSNPLKKLVGRGSGSTSLTASVDTRA